MGIKVSVFKVDKSKIKLETKNDVIKMTSLFSVNLLGLHEVHVDVHLKLQF